jgi:hypothetical protein
MGFTLPSAGMTTFGFAQERLGTQNAEEDA